MLHAKITTKGQITLPVELRAKLGLLPGSRVTFEEQGDGSFVLRRKSRDIREMRGMLKREGRPVSLADMDEAIAAGAARGL